MNEMDILYAVLGALLLLLLALAYWLTHIYRVVKWIVRNVHIVPNSNGGDPDFARIKKFFGLPDDENEQGE